MRCGERQIAQFPERGAAAFQLTSKRRCRSLQCGGHFLQCGYRPALHHGRAEQRKAFREDPAALAG